MKVIIILIALSSLILSAYTPFEFDRSSAFIRISWINGTWRSEDLSKIVEGKYFFYQYKLVFIASNIRNEGTVQIEQINIDSGEVFETSEMPYKLKENRLILTTGTEKEETLCSLHIENIEDGMKISNTSNCTFFSEDSKNPGEVFFYKDQSSNKSPNNDYPPNHELAPLDETTKFFFLKSWL